MPKGHDTWLTPLEAVYLRHYPLADVPFGPLAKYAWPLVSAVGSDRVCRDLEGYLTKTNPEYVSIPHWARTFGSWAIKEKPRPPVVAPLCTESAPRPLDTQRLRALAQGTDL